MRRATVGTKKPVWMKDKDGNPVKVDEVAEYSDGLMAKLLAAHWPEKYREVVKSELSGPGGEPLQLSAPTQVVIYLPQKEVSDGNGNGSKALIVERSIPSLPDKAS
jgi:hypothetical protein